MNTTAEQTSKSAVSAFAEDSEKMTAIDLKNNLLRMIAETNDPVKLRMMMEWFGIVREEKDWWLEISEKERQMILEGRKQLANGQGIPHEQVRVKVHQLLQELQNAKSQRT